MTPLSPIVSEEARELVQDFADKYFAASHDKQTWGERDKLLKPALAALLRYIAELEEDRGMLDWWEAQKHWNLAFQELGITADFPGSVERFVVWDDDGYESEHPSLREAISAARSAIASAIAQEKP